MVFSKISNESRKCSQNNTYKKVRHQAVLIPVNYNTYKENTVR